MVTKISKKCLCGKVFYFYPSLIKRKKYCSKKCFYKFRPSVPHGLKHIFTTPCKSWFKNRDIRLIGNSFAKGNKPNITSFVKGKHYSLKTEFKKGENLGEKNNKWKGDNVGYYGLHTWVQRTLGKAIKCEKCGRTKKVHWANKSRKYLRDKTDWFQYCSKCHGKYDTENRGTIKKKYGNNFR